MTPTPQNLPEGWYADGFKAWALADAVRQDDEIRRLSGQFEVLREKLEGKAKQDIDAAHKRIRSLTTEAESLREEAASLRDAVFEKKFKNLAFTIIVAVLTVILVMLAATLIPAHWAH